MHTLRIENGKVDYRCSFVKTPKYVDESAAQQVKYRSFGHNAPGGFLKNLHMPANAANTSIVYHGGKLLTLFEGGLPWEMDLDTLETLGPCNYDGALKNRDTFSAHGKLHPRTGDYFNFCMGAGIKPKINLYQISPQGKMAKRNAIAIDRMAFCHDTAMTENYLIFMVMPVNFTSPLQVLLARDTIDRNMEFQPEEGTLFSRNLFTQLRPSTGQLTRYRLDMQTGASKKEILPSAIPGEFPQWDLRKTGSETRYTYTAGICENETPGFYNALQRVDYQTSTAKVYDCGPWRYTSEPIFVPRTPDADEADGYLLCIIYDASTELSELMVLDAESMADEIAVVPLKNHIPHGFHCGYIPL